MSKTEHETHSIILPIVLQWFLHSIQKHYLCRKISLVTWKINTGESPFILLVYWFIYTCIRLVVTDTFVVFESTTNLHWKEFVLFYVVILCYLKTLFDFGFFNVHLMETLGKHFLKTLTTNIIWLFDFYCLMLTYPVILEITISNKVHVDRYTFARYITIFLNGILALSHNKYVLLIGHA